MRGIERVERDGAMGRGASGGAEPGRNAWQSAATGGWVLAIGASVLAATAYSTDRRQAADVFKDSPLFPVILAALGISMIVVTVSVQRNASRLLERFGSVTHDGRPRFPGGVALLLSPALVAALLLPQGVEHDRERRRAVQDSIDGLRAPTPETRPLPRP